MPHQHNSAVYRVAPLGLIPRGHLVYAEDRPGAKADVYLHPLHVREPFVEQFNQITRHHVGHGLWGQRWSAGGRMMAPAQGYDIAMCRWEIVPAAAMPSGCVVVPLEEAGTCLWLIREGYVTRELRDEMNRMLQRAVGDGLWVQRWDEPRPGVDGAVRPALVPAGACAG